MDTDPGGARILVDGEDKGRTPTSVTLKRKNRYAVTFRLDGYEDVVINVDKKFKFGATVIGNIFSWGLIGIVVDVANGSAYQLTPEQLSVTLSANGAASARFDHDTIRVYFFEPGDVVEPPVTSTLD